MTSTLDLRSINYDEMTDQRRTLVSLRARATPDTTTEKNLGKVIAFLDEIRAAARAAGVPGA